MKRLRLVVPAAIILFVAAISYFRLADNYESALLDLRFRLRPAIPATDKIAIIEIGEDTIRKIGRFPFDRRYHAFLVKALSEAGAHSIIFDIFFSEPQAADGELEEAIKKAGNVYLPFVFDVAAPKKFPLRVGRVISADGYIAPCLEALGLSAKGTGHINIIPDPDGKYRRVPLYIRYENKFYPYLSFLATSGYLGIPEKDVYIRPGKYLMCGRGIKIPFDDNSCMIVNFSGRWGEAYRHYSYADILQSYFAGASGKKPNLDLGALKDKVCIVGLTAAGTTDLHPNPFETLYPAVGIHAEVFNSILNKKFITRASREANLFILAALGLLVSLAALKMKPVKGFLTLFAAVPVFTLAAILAFNLFGVWIDLFYPVLVMAFAYMGWMLHRYAAEWRKRLLVESELKIAKKIQESFLPKKMPSVEGLEAAAAMFTASQVGGDLYDLIGFGGGKMGVMIGDVTGKGVPASLFMAMVTSAFKSFALPAAAPEEVLSNLNSKLVRESSLSLFVTVFYSVFDMRARAMRYANGGHMPALYLGKGSPPRFLDVEEGVPLGLEEGPYSAREVNLNEGDVFIFYTDGVTEAMNTRREQYGRERLVAVAEKNKGLSAKAILLSVEKDMRKFEPRSAQHDDITLIVIKVENS